jgi:hypothetical protein
MPPAHTLQPHLPGHPVQRAQRRMVAGADGVQGGSRVSVCAVRPRTGTGPHACIRGAHDASPQALPSRLTAPNASLSCAALVTWQVVLSLRSMLASNTDKVSCRMLSGSQQHNTAEPRQQQATQPFARLWHITMSCCCVSCARSASPLVTRSTWRAWARAAPSCPTGCSRTIRCRVALGRAGAPRRPSTCAAGCSKALRSGS